MVSSSDQKCEVQATLMGVVTLWLSTSVVVARPNFASATMYVWSRTIDSHVIPPDTANIDRVFRQYGPLLILSARRALW